MEMANDKKIVLTKWLLFILTIGAGLSVANIYYNQPMLGMLAAEFHLSSTKISLIPFLSQAGYALGILFLSPLGDRFERKRLIIITMLLLIISIVAIAISSTIEWLIVFSLIVGILSTVTQQIVPLAVSLAAPDKRGKVIGIVTGGILLGILLARTVSGYVTDQLGWRYVFWISAMLMTITMFALLIMLPKVLPTTDISYIKVMKSLGTLFVKYPVLRLAAFIQSLIFGAFLAFWSNLAALFQQPAYHLGATAVGLVSIVGAGGALIAPVAGKLSDTRGPQTVVTLGAGLLVISFGILGGIQNSIVALIIAVIIMDLAVQSSQVSNQAQIYALDPTARSRLNTVFMTAMFCGGAAGSISGTIAFEHFGWTGTCTIAGIAVLLAFILSLALILATSSTLSFNVSAQTTHNEKESSMDQTMLPVQALQNNLLSDFMPDNYREVARKQVLVDKIPVELTRYARTDRRNNVIGGEHLSTVIDTTGKLKGFARMDADLIGKELPSQDDAYNIAMQFIQRYAPDLLENSSLNFVAKHDEPVLVDKDGNTTTQTLTGIKVKMCNHKDDLYFWVIVGADRKVMVFERDIYWVNLPYGHRRTEKWLHDNWLKDKHKINKISVI